MIEFSILGIYRRKCKDKVVVYGKVRGMPCLSMSSALPRSAVIIVRAEVKYTPALLARRAGAEYLGFHGDDGGLEVRRALCNHISPLQDSYSG